MIDIPSEKLHYDALYAMYSQLNRCKVCIDNLPRAQDRVRQVLTAFGIADQVRAKRVLDVGCGLGYVSEALRLEGAKVVALDMSESAIRWASTTFAQVDFRCAVFPGDFHDEEKFDLIWILDICSLNTFDVNEMNNVISWAESIVEPGGAIVVGWHSDFSGRTVSNWCHWPLETIRALHTELRFSRPRVPQMRFSLPSWLTIRICKVIGKSCPIFFIRRKQRAAGMCPFGKAA